MRMNSARVLVFAAALCGVAGGSPQPTLARVWLSQVPALPATAEAAYAQWVEIGGGLKPGAAAERVSDGIKTEAVALSRPMQSPVPSSGPLSAHDKALVGRISVFSDTATVLQKIQATREAQAALLQKWHAELNALEQRRLRARSALPACHNEAGAPSQLAIRDIEQSFVAQKMQIAVRYLTEFRPLVEQLTAAVSPRIEHGDAAMSAWMQLRSLGTKAQLAPVARGAESDALLDVALVQRYIQDSSKQAAQAAADRNALRRVYAGAKGC